MEEIILNAGQQKAMQAIVRGDNVFIDGPGGVGKSVLVREIQKRFESSTVFMSPTGIAALNIGGTTIHRAFQFPLRLLTSRDHVDINEKTAGLFGTRSPVKRIVIDEISMVRTDMFQAIDGRLKMIRKNRQPFGGLQVIVVGDFFQLPPVVTALERDLVETMYGSPFCFTSNAWHDAMFTHIELDEVMRQSDAEFIKHLTVLRKKEPTFKKSLEFFNQYTLENNQALLNDDPVFVCTTNRLVDNINFGNYSQLKGQEYTFLAEREGIFKLEPAPETLKLRVGTKVMVTVNHPEMLYCNGQIGYVSDVIHNTVTIITEKDERTIHLSKYKWEERDYYVSNGRLCSSIIGTYTQIPLKHAWALTVHKCQGQTLENGVINMGQGAFCHGQTYVALSRVKSLKGLALERQLRPRDIIVDKEVVDFYASYL